MPGISGAETLPMRRLLAMTARRVPGRFAVLGAEVALRHMRPRQVLDELADAAPAHDPVQAFVDGVVGELDEAEVGKLAVGAVWG